MNRQCLTLALLFSVCFVGAARADLVPVAPEVYACASLTVGSACTYNGPGTCQNATCTTGTSTSQYGCVKCVPNGSGGDSGCAVGGRLARTVGPWLAAGLFGAATMLVRRKPRR
jgi:hypothetical protein